MALVLCDKKNKFLFEVLPDYFPQGRLTGLEEQLWLKYHKKKNEDSESNG